MTAVEKLRASEQGLQELASRIEEEYQQAQAAHQRRMERFVEAVRRWRNRVPPPVKGEENKSNFQVPLIQWHTLGLWARHLGALLGDDAEIVAAPVGPSDYRRVHKIGRYMTWRMFSSIQITLPLATFEFRRILHGRSHAYSPFKRDTYVAMTPGGRRKRKVCYEGPGFEPLWPDDLVVPPEDVQTIHDFSFVLRKLRLRPPELLRGEIAGRYFDIRSQYDAIEGFAVDHRPRGAGEEVKDESDETQGIEQTGAPHSRGQLTAWEYYGYGDVDRRTGEEPELVATYLPDLQQVVGLQDLVELYPQSPKRRPFVESALIPSGEYWGMGVEELLESIEDEATTNENLFTEGVQYSIGPFILYKPASIGNPKRLKYEPCTAEPCEDPAGAKIVQPTLNPNGYLAKRESTLAMAERVDGMSDMAMGRTADRPNAPRTAAGTAMLLESGNVRIALNLMVMREDWSKILKHFWELDCEFPRESLFFRVTEEDAKGLFLTAKGGSVMTAREFTGEYDFRIKFANSVWSREAEKERSIQLYGLDLQNPLVAHNPKALWMVTQRVHKALGDPNFADLLPEPPDLGTPKNPLEEWTLALEGEDLVVNPLDNDDLHMVDHQRRVVTALGEKPEDQDQDAIDRMLRHIVDHRHQRQAKAIIQGMAQALGTALASSVAGGQEQGQGPGPDVAPPALAPQPPLASLAPEEQPQ